MRTLDYIRAFSHYSRVDEAIFTPPVIPFASEISISTDNDLMLSIFAPDPVTGIPRSDLSIIMSRDAAPEVSQFIRDNLMRPVNSDAGIDDGNFVLDSIRDTNEGVQHYAERLREIVAKYSKQD